MKTKKKIDFSKIYSFSKLDLFKQCPKAYHFSYLSEVYSKMKSKLRRLPENIWPFQTLGKAVHDAITLFLHLPEKQRVKKMLKQQLQKSWRSEAQYNKLPPLGKWGGFKSLEEERSYYKQALQMLFNFYRIFDKTRTVKYLPTDDLKNSIEDYKNLIQPINKKVDISGKFDLILNTEKGIEVVDFKTGKRDTREPFQLNFYRLLAELNFKEKVTQTSFYFLRQSRINKFPASEIKIKKIKKKIQAKVAEIRKEKKFSPHPSKLCRYCLFRTFCPAKEEVAQFTKQPLQKELLDDLPF